ncbi:MAG: hypothetical protein SCALA702_00440 [Melioribacteraceae bacterium]|nr:MAG: hypothetical protein SCALA702_00440 [Melioribacteraceae bacterium]
MEEKYNAIIKECMREEENCLYTSTSFYYWLSYLNKVKAFFIATPLIFGGIASIEILSDSQDDFAKYLVALVAFVAGVLPSIYSALKIEARIEKLETVTNKFKVLQGKFRRLRTIDIHNSTLDEEFRTSILELEDLKSNGLTIPERFFARAQKKIKKGDFDFSADDKKV